VWLDAAAFVPTHELNLQVVPADAVCLSFYKILGFPTGIGALIIRKPLLEKLRKPWFAGGTVRGVSLEEYVLEPGYERFEDGTINYAAIPALKFVFKYIQELGGIQTIEQHVTTLTATALDQLSTIPGVEIYGPTTMEQHGGTIALNITNRARTCISYATIEQLAAQRNISLRGGCFCNPGAGSKAFQLDNQTMRYLLNTLQRKTKTEANVPGAVRISFGLANNQTDVDTVVQFIRDVTLLA
jgi:selenocysteine lyase/cysteine desulfurase